MKNKAVPLAVAVAILGCVLAVRASVNAGDVQARLDQERYKRLTAEQALKGAEDKARSLAAQLADSEKKFADIQAILDQGRTAASDLQNQLEAAAKEKDVMAAQLRRLQEAAVAVDGKTGQ